MAKTTDDLLAKLSTTGYLLGILGIETAVLSRAHETQRHGQKIGERLIEMQVIRAEDLDRVLALQTKIRACEDIEAIHAFIEEAREAAHHAKEALDFAIPATGAEHLS